MNHKYADNGTNAVLITGISGYVGGLIGACLLKSTTDVIIGVIRDVTQKEAIVNNLLVEYEALTGVQDPKISQRIELCTLEDVLKGKATSDSSTLPRIKEIIHSAGSVDYFDEEQLKRANIDYTEKMLEVARNLKVDRFTFISTAFSCGYIDGVAQESLHSEPDSDPTMYTLSKRHAERLVAKSGIPYLIIRPSILIGDSKTGRYSGKRYGLYQIWMGVERLLCSRYHKTWHTVAPKSKLSFLHQDSFQAAFWHAYERFAENEIIHIVSRHDTLPTMREVWDLWVQAVARPETVYYYDNFDEVPLKSIDIRQRSYLTFAATNLKIGAHHWQFGDDKLRRMQSQGLQFSDVTLGSVQTCLDRFVSTSKTVQDFLQKNKSELYEATPKVVEVPIGFKQAK